jgi:hypothetical protein
MATAPRFRFFIIAAMLSFYRVVTPLV